MQDCSNWKLIRLFILVYPTRFCLASFRPYESGNVNRVTSPSGPNTFDGILSNESDNERESDWSCILEVCRYIDRLTSSKIDFSINREETK